MGDAANGANSQTLSNDLGKILRIDPREQPGAVPYGIPASNPFSGPGVMPEIYALGLRNPYRASFAPNGDLILPDVGQVTWEEVNVGRVTGTPAATTLAGANLGWSICEGFCSPPKAGLTDPFFQYGHAPTGDTTGCAVIGGHVVRDPSFPGLSGRYLYGDLCRADLRTLDLATPGGDPRPAGLSLPTGESLLGFGEDGRGCVYVASSATVYRVAVASEAGAACTQILPAGPAVPPPGSASLDTTKPILSLSARHRQRLRRALRLFASCDEACTLGAIGSLRLSGTSTSAAPGQRVRLLLKLKPRPFAKAKRELRQGRKVRLRVTVTATDPSGNSSEKAFRIKLSLPPS